MLSHNFWVFFGSLQVSLPYYFLQNLFLYPIPSTVLFEFSIFSVSFPIFHWFLPFATLPDVVVVLCWVSIFVLQFLSKLIALVCCAVRCITACNKLWKEDATKWLSDLVNCGFHSFVLWDPFQIFTADWCSCHLLSMSSSGRSSKSRAAQGETKFLRYPICFETLESLV